MQQQVDAGAEPAAPDPGRRRHRRAVAAAALAVLVLLPAAVVGAAALHLSGNLTRIDGVFDDLDRRPAVPASAAGATNILVIGTDRGSEPGAADAGRVDLAREASRSDSLMLLHLDADRGAASVISIPRDTVVDVPGHGPQPIRAAFGLGGPRLGVQTVEAFTGVRLDHVAVVDWSRVGDLVDAVGGVHVDLAADTRDPVSGATWAAGSVVLDGPGALAFVRQTEGLPRGDLDRVARQHAVLAAVTAEALHQEMRKDPLLLYGFLDLLTERLAVDADLSLPELAALAFSMRDFRSAQARFLTMPVVAAGAGAPATLQPDREASGSLWSAVVNDRVGEWEAEHPGAVTPPAVR